MALKITSIAFPHGGDIPVFYTCQGEDISPPLSWEGAPPYTKSFALIVDDPDAPDPKAPRMTWVHWILFDIHPQTNSLGEIKDYSETIVGIGTQGMTDFRRPGYGGPCPPIGKHRYFFKLYALDIMLNLRPGISKAELLEKMMGHILEEAQLMGYYEKS